MGGAHKVEETFIGDGWSVGATEVGTAKQLTCWLLCEEGTLGPAKETPCSVVASTVPPEPLLTKPQNYHLTGEMTQGPAPVSQFRAKRVDLE